jgi:hypothetical protein
MILPRARTAHRSVLETGMPRARKRSRYRRRVCSISMESLELVSCGMLIGKGLALSSRSDGITSAVASAKSDESLLAREGGCGRY